MNSNRIPKHSSTFRRDREMQEQIKLNIKYWFYKQKYSQIISLIIFYHFNYSFEIHIEQFFSLYSTEHQASIMLHFDKLVVVYLILLTFSEAASSGNFICNGGFQENLASVSFVSYIPFLRPNQVYMKGFISQNNSCWYWKNSTQKLEIKRIYNPPASPSYVLDMIGISHLNLSLCQTLTLNVGKVYNFSLQLYANQNDKQNQTHVYLNTDNLLLNLRSKSIMDIVSGWKVFTVTKETNQICITHFSSDQNNLKGVNVDNVILIQIQPIRYDQQIWITKRIIENENQVKIVVFQTDYFVPMDIRSLLENKILVGIKNKEYSNLKYQLKYKNNSALQVYIFNAFSDYHDIFISFPQKVRYDVTQIYYHISLQQSLDTGGLSIFAQVLKWTKVIGKTFLCSYMVFSMIGMWNLLLLYNFIFVKFMPAFTKIALDTFCITFFSESSLISQIDMFQQALDIFCNFEVDESQIKLPQILKGNIWFGSLDISEGYLSNNLETFILLTLLVLKLWIFSLFNSFLAKRTNVRKIGFRVLLNIFFVQIISNCPQMIIGSISNIIFSANKYPSSKISCALSIISILAICFIIFINYMIMKQLNAAKKQKSGSQKKKQNLPNAYNLHRSDQLLHFNFLHILIPTLVTAQHYQLFFIFVTFVLAQRFKQFYSNRKIFEGFQCFKLYVVNIGWIFYHLCFMLLWIVDKIEFDPQQDSSEQSFINFCGIYILFFIVFCAIVEICDFIISLPSKYLKSLIKTVRLLFRIQKVRITNLVPSIKIKEQKEQKLQITKMIRDSRQSLQLVQKTKKKQVKKTKQIMVARSSLNQTSRQTQKAKYQQMKTQVQTQQASAQGQLTIVKQGTNRARNKSRFNEDNLRMKSKTIEIEQIQQQ